MTSQNIDLSSWDILCIVDRRMLGWKVRDELEEIWKEKFVDYLT
jgi:hypothetical protein